MSLHMIFLKKICNFYSSLFPKRSMQMFFSAFLKCFLEFLEHQIQSEENESCFLHLLGQIYELF